MTKVSSGLIKDIIIGKQIKIEGEMMIQEKTSDASNKTYLTVNLHDTVGDAIYINVFSSSPFYDTLSQFEVVYGEITLKASQNKEFTNYNILGFTEKEKPVVSPFKSDVLIAKLREHINTISNKDLRDIIVNLFKVPGLTTKLFTNPGNVENGYAYETGLLVHIVRMLDLSDSLIDTIKNFDSYKVEDEKPNAINKDMMKVAIILHDVGKVDAIEKKMYKINKTLNGTLFEDSYLSMVMAEKLITESNLNQEQMQVLLHVIGAAKGSVSYGATHTARTLEAHVLSFIDKLDYHLALFEDVNRHVVEDVNIAKAKASQKELVLISFDDVSPKVEEVVEPEEISENEESLDEDISKLHETTETTEKTDESEVNETTDKSETKESTPEFDPFDLVDGKKEKVVEKESLDDLVPEDKRYVYKPNTDELDEKERVNEELTNSTNIEYRTEG